MAAAEAEAEAALVAVVAVARVKEVVPDKEVRAGAPAQGPDRGQALPRRQGQEVPRGQCRVRHRLRQRLEPRRLD
jgi:hypothetical protein